MKNKKPLNRNISSATMRGYRSQLVAGINQCGNGGIVEIDLTTARKLVEIVDMAIHMQKNHEYPGEVL